MSIAGVIVVFVLCWWFCFFLALPFGARPLENPELGHAESAPAKPRLKLKAMIATAGAFVLTIAIWYIIEADLISFYRPSSG
jgi:predicted secreted protein